MLQWVHPRDWIQKFCCRVLKEWCQVDTHLLISLGLLNRQLNLLHNCPWPIQTYPFSVFHNMCAWDRSRKFPMTKYAIDIFIHVFLVPICLNSHSPRHLIAHVFIYYISRRKKFQDAQQTVLLSMPVWIDIQRSGSSLVIFLTLKYFYLTAVEQRKISLFIVNFVIV